MPMNTGFESDTDSRQSITPTPSDYWNLDEEFNDYEKYLDNFQSSTSYTQKSSKTLLSMGNMKTFYVKIE